MASFRLSGRLPEEVSDVLQAMLVEKSIPGTWSTSARASPTAPVQAILYRVADVLIQIRNVEFIGAGEAELPALTAASKRVFEREYSRTVLHSLVEKQLLPVYYSRGYLKASFGEPQPKVVKQPSAANEEGPRNLDHRGCVISRHTGTAIQVEVAAVVRQPGDSDRNLGQDGAS